MCGITAIFNIHSSAADLRQQALKMSNVSVTAARTGAASIKEKPPSSPMNASPSSILHPADNR